MERRGDLLAQLRDARARTDAVLGAVAPGAAFDRPIPERHRIVFYLGHLEAFDWNLLRAPLGLSAIEPGLGRLFAFGIDPVDGDLPDDQPGDWPPLDEIERYRRRVRATLDAAPVARVDPTLLHVAVEHRLMHAETLTYMLHQLPRASKRSQPETPAPESSPDAAAEAATVEVPAGEATLGLARAAGAFGWDNEFEAHRVRVPGFTLGATPVTNGGYLAFVRAGGRPPGFWFERDGAWWLRTVFSERPLPLDWPVYVRHADAEAYARWAGGALPTEAQWHRAAYGTPDGAERAYPWGDDAPDASRGNFGLQRWDPTPVGAHPAGASAFGVHDLLGNGWEWTSSPFAPFAGFERFAFYPGYSADFFDGAHFVLKGGSARTATCFLRRSFRNWFQPDYPYVYATFRCVTA